MGSHSVLSTYPRLLADIGGTNARFAIESQPHQIAQLQTLRCADFLQLLDALRYYLSLLDSHAIRYGMIATANPVHGDEVKMTNHHWAFSIRQLAKDLDFERLLVINDFTAQALAITQMQKNDWLPIGHWQTIENPDRQDASMAVIGPGTGLGVSGLIPDRRGSYLPLASEGGHAAYGAVSAFERQLLDFAATKFPGHVSAERLLQGQGLCLIYSFLSASEQTMQAADITRKALNEGDALCRMALSHYCEILGSFCADVALMLGAKAGVFITGGIVPRFVNFLQASAFRQRFEYKGRLRDYLKPIPTYVVVHPNPGILGASVALHQSLGE